LVLIGALLCGLDAPALLLQGAAWASMLARGVRGNSLSRALIETFDGRHPCELCRRAGAAAPQQRLGTAPSPKTDFFPPLAVPAASAAGVRRVSPARLAVAESRAAAPPVPPPNSRAC
jgi:hypothetical protein